MGGVAPRTGAGRVAGADAGDDAPPPLTPGPPLEDVLANPTAAAALARKVGWPTGADGGPAVGVGMDTMMASLPVSRLEALTGARLTLAEIESLLSEANAARTPAADVGGTGRVLALQGGDRGR